MKIKRLFFDIDGHYGLDVGETVKVWSYISNRYLSQWLTKDGYKRTKLHGKQTLIHRLVAELTMGKCPKGKQVNHIDGNKTNNSPSNLEYITPNENIQHAIKMGMHVANDPKRNGRYKDGRCADIDAYKRQWYLSNRGRILKAAKERYNAKKDQ